MIILIGENDCAPSEIIGLFKNYEDAAPILERFKYNKEYIDKHGYTYSFDRVSYTSIDVGELKIKIN